MRRSSPPQKITAESTNCKALGISVDTAIAAAKNPPGRDPLVLHAGMFSPGGTGFDIPGYVSYITPKQPRVYIDSPYKAYQAIIGAVGNGTTVTSADAQAQMQRAARSKSINDLLRPQIQALLARPDLSTSDRARLDQHLTAIRDIEVKISTTTLTIPDADVATMKTIDPKPYDQSTRDQAVKLFMDLMAFSAAADYSRVAVLKIGDRIDDHTYTFNGQSAKFHDVSHRQASNALEFHAYLDRMMLGLLQVPPGQAVVVHHPDRAADGPGRHDLDQPVRDGRPLVQQHSVDPGGNRQRVLQAGAVRHRRHRRSARGVARRQGGDASVSGVNKMLNTLLQAAAVTKSGGAAYDDFGDASLPKGIFSEMKK